MPNGPYRKAGNALQAKAIVSIFREKRFKEAAFGYFGHMWELYALWAFIPLIISKFVQKYDFDMQVSFWSFIIIAIGSIGCVIGGILSERVGVKKTAMYALLSSGICCLLFPLFFALGNSFLFFTFLLFWGMVVIMDSPLFSTLVAQSAPQEAKGTALTFVNCIGFSITILSIELLNVLQVQYDDISIFMLLGIGPAIGLTKLFMNRHK